MKQNRPAQDPVSEEDKGRIVLFMGGVRSGTTVFRRMLASHPRVRDRGEIFNSNNQQGFFKYFREQIAQNPDFAFPEHHGKLFLSYLASMVPKDNDGIALLDIKYEHLNLVHDAWQLPFTNPPMLRLIKRSGFKVVHLRRQHFFSVVSNLIAVQTGRYHKPADGSAELPEKRAVALERAGVLTAMKKRKRAAEIVDSSFDEQQRLSIDYEGVFDEAGDFQPAVCERVAGFLGIDNRFERQPALKKVIDEPLSAVITNYEEIRDLETTAL
jgi:LPS sulfotransferase NodH